MARIAFARRPSRIAARNRRRVNALAGAAHARADGLGACLALRVSLISQIRH